MIGQTLGHYRIEARIGEGGMGVVYRASDTRLGRTVAIKVLHADRIADPERRRRFVHEAKAASALNHPNIITIHEIDAQDGVDFIVMEFVEGQTLDQIIGRRGLRLTEAFKYGVQIADALAKAHAAGIVHRDLKPANIMVTGDGLVKSSTSAWPSSPSRPAPIHRRRPKRSWVRRLPIPRKAPSSARSRTCRRSRRRGAR